MAIRFYYPGKEYGFFSNFSRHPVTVDGKEYATSEHFFQAAKYFITDPEYAEEVRQAETPRIAARMGRDESRTILSDWDNRRDDYMRLVVAAKFDQNKGIGQLLKHSVPEELIEAAPNDFYWGEGADRTGKNMLGAVLMEVRDALNSGTIDDYVSSVEGRLNL